MWYHDEFPHAAKLGNELWSINSRFPVQCRVQSGALPRFFAHHRSERFPKLGRGIWNGAHWNHLCTTVSYNGICFAVAMASIVHLYRHSDSTVCQHVRKNSFQKAFKLFWYPIYLCIYNSFARTFLILKIFTLTQTWLGFAPSRRFSFKLNNVE